MADILREVFGIFDKRYRDMGDGSYAETVAIGGEFNEVAIARAGLNI